MIGYNHKIIWLNFRIMKKGIQIIFLQSSLLLVSCKGDIETISVERNGSLSFQVEGVPATWRSDSFQFYPGQSVVKVFEEVPAVSILFTRHYLVFGGISPEGKAFELTVTVDLPDQADLRHIYTSEYSRNRGGLNDISLIITEAVNPPAYSMTSICADELLNAFFVIDRQNQSEKLIAGSLGATLCDINQPQESLIIFNAIFKDIPYIDNN
jgi:hypothetical protein